MKYWGLRPPIFYATAYIAIISSLHIYIITMRKERNRPFQLSSDKSSYEVEGVKYEY